LNRRDIFGQSRRKVWQDGEDTFERLEAKRYNKEQFEHLDTSWADLWRESYEYEEDHEDELPGSFGELLSTILNRY